MDKLTIEAMRDLVLRELTDMITTWVVFLPNLIAALLILIVGWGISRLLELAVRHGLRTLRVDRLASRHRIAEHVGLAQSPSDAIGKVVFWLFMVTFLLSSIHMLGVSAVSATMERLLGYVPNLIGAAIVALLGVLLARFLGSVTGSAAAAAGVPSAARLAFAVQMLGIGLVVIVVVEQLGFAANILMAPLVVLVATAGFTGGLAFALGARPVITHILAGHFLKQSLPRESLVEIDGQRGVVERVGATDTLLKNGERRWSIPNGQLLELIVMR